MAWREVTQDEFILIYYNCLLKGIPFSYKCKGITQNIGKGEPKIILAVNYRRNLFKVFMPTRS